MAWAYAVVFVVTFATTALLTPFVRRLAVRRGALVPPSDRAVHERPLPNIGGVATLGGVVAALVICGTGLIDDVRKVHREGVSAPAKLAGMVLAGSALSLAGVSTIFFRVPFFGIFSLTPDLSTFVTVVWVVGMANAINLIDGLDGLAAGVTAIAAGSFFLYGVRLDHVGVLAEGNIGPLLALITLAICLAL